VFPVKSTLQNDPVLRFFKDAVMDRLGSHLRQVLLFGSRARGDATGESDYDLPVVVDHRLAVLSADGASVHYGYDAENRLAAVTNDVFTVAYAYTPDGWDAGYNVALSDVRDVLVCMRPACRVQITPTP
jgi:predicted nucleotidyltransferase